MKTIRLIAFRFVLLLGWGALLACTTLVAVEQSGLAERWLRSAMTEPLSRSGARIGVEHVAFDWLEPGVELRGVTITGERELFRAERLHLALGLTSELRPRIARVELERGRLLVGDSLMELAERLTPAASEDQGGGSGAAVLPTVQVRDFDLALEVGGESRVPLARIDLSVYPTTEAPSSDVQTVASGRITLPLAEGAQEPARLHFVGTSRDQRHIQWTASAEDLYLEAVRLPDARDLEGLRDLAPHGRFDVDCEGTLDLDEPLEMSGELRLRAREIALEVRAGCAPILDGTLDLAARLDSSREQPPWHPQAWMAGARLSARWRGYGLRAGARLGSIARPGTLLEAWARIPGLPVNEELVELFGHAPFLDNPYQALKPDGEFDFTVGAHLLEGWSAPDSLVPHLEVCAELKNAGRLSAAWLGIPPKPGKPRVAFPMPVRARSVRASFARTARIPRPEFLGVHFIGDKGTDSVDVQYYAWSPPIDVPPFSPKAQVNEEELRIRSDGINVDPALRRALRGLAELPGAADVWDTYQPAAGRIAVDLRLADRMQIPRGPAGYVDLTLSDCSAAWRELPVPVHGIDGTIRYTTDGLGDSSVTFALEGALESAPEVRLSGRVRQEPDESLGSEGITLDITALDLEGPEREIVAASVPGIGDALDAFGPDGRADVRYRRARARNGGGVTTRLEVRPNGELTLRPTDFPLAARSVQGRIVSEWLERGPAASQGDEPGAEPGDVTRVAPLIGVWPGGALVALNASFPAGSPAVLEVLGSGLCPSDEAFFAALRAALPAEWSLDDAVGLDPALFGGALDFVTRIEPGELDGRATHTFRLRRNDLELRAGEGVRELEGDLVLADERLSSDRLAGILGSARVLLSSTDIRFEAGGLQLSTRISTSGFRLDREHLEPFVDEATLEEAFGSIGLRGRVDVPRADLSFERDAEGHTRLVVRGGLELTDLHADLGVPLSIGSALGSIEELVVEDGNVRWLARLDDVYGRLFGRELGPARALATLQGSRLSLEAFQGTFARGTLRGLEHDPQSGSAHARTGPVLSVDLEPPHAFGLGLALVDADVAVLLKGLFPDGVASRGRLTTDLQLHGELDDLLSIRGVGSAEVLESRLWSIPVFRDLFSRLGLEATAVFDEMHCSFDVRDAVVTMPEVELRSPILKLVGDGRLDLDGRLHYDLRVHYGALDKVRLVREIVYLVQNSLLSVAIRGDMSRPIVLLRGSLTRLFRPVPDEYRHLPLPPYSRLPERF